MSKTEIVSEIRIKDFKIEELKTPYSDTLGTPEIPLVYAIVETPDGEKKIFQFYCYYIPQAFPWLYVRKRGLSILLLLHT